MLPTAVLVLSLFNPLAGLSSGQGAHARVAMRHVHVGAWSVVVARDRFAGTSSCSLDARDVSLHRGTAIFRLGRGLDTTRAVFRLDGGPPREVSEAFDAVEARGFFPERGWIVDPAGGEAALPAAYLSGVRAVTLRVSPKLPPRVFKVAHLDEAIATAQAYGCVDVAP
jgi:hypothetical protein